MRLIFMLLLAAAAALVGLYGGLHGIASEALGNQIGALTYATPGLTPQQWDDLYFVEYVRATRYSKYMGKDENSIFQVKNTMERKKGDSDTFALVNRLKGAGVTGNATLSGNEEKLDARSQKIAVEWLRNAVLVTKRDEGFSSISIRMAAKAMLKLWSMETLRNDITQALASIDGVNFAAATAAQKNAWVTNNADRVLFGITAANYSTTFATAVANVDNAADKLTGAMISTAKAMAKDASPNIRPITINGDEEWYVFWANSRAYRDLKLDTNVISTNQWARERGIDNPLFSGDGLVWDGVIIREIPKMYSANGDGILGDYPLIGTAGIAVGVNFLTGAQAVGIEWRQTAQSKEKTETDYGFLYGVGIDECRGIQKLRFGTDPAVDTTTPKDHGMVTVWAAAVA